jgi:quaternary ammonium compound-resistance protein SugE
MPTQPTSPTDEPSDRRRSVNWLELCGATLIDVAATYALTASDGWRRPGVGLLAVAGFLVAIYLFGLALAGLGPTVCYSFFGAVGIATVAVLGFVLAPDSISLLRIVSLMLVVVGVAGVAVTSGVNSGGGPH